MFPRFKQVVERLIKIHGKMSLQEFNQKDSVLIKISKPNFLDFSVEKNGNTLKVGYYREARGRLISDPIFVFHINSELSWEPIRLEQVLGDTIIGKIEDGTYLYYPRRFKDVKSFAVTCANEWRFYYLD